jgi:uncharacterized protein (TIGR03437 family)
VLIAGTSSLAAPLGAAPGAHPVSRGEFLEIYATGLGEVDHAPPDGFPASENPLSRTVATPSVSIGDIAAPVTFSGLAPNFVGLYQVNVLVPDGTPVGNTVPLRLSIGGESANEVTVAVQ